MSLRKKVEIFFQILWSSHNIWTLIQYDMLDWKILTNLKIYLNLILYLGGQKNINNTFCTVCIERRYVLLYNISNLWPKPLLQHYLALNYIPIVLLAIAIWYCCKHPNELCTPAYSSVTLVLGFSATTLKKPFFVLS